MNRYKVPESPPKFKGKVDLKLRPKTRYYIDADKQGMGKKK